MTCEHYKRGCDVRAECCQQWVACRLCHNEQFTDHEIDRHAIKDMRCNACQTVQPCAQTCAQCSASMATYFCKVCNLFDDDGAAKQVFHCDGCGICRVGGRDNFFHCATCCGCYPHSLQDRHKCLEGSMHRECAICLEVTFASVESVHVLPCGHVLHGSCWEEYIRHGHYRCPSCRTRMFWSENVPSADGNDDENESDDEEDEEEDESGDDDDDDDGASGDADEESGEDDESGDETVSDMSGDETVSDASFVAAARGSSTSPPPAPAATVLSTESGVAHQVVNAILSAFVSTDNGSGVSSSTEDVERAVQSSAHASQQ